MDVGVDTKAPLSDFYSQDVIDALTSGADTLSRWAIPQGQGDLLGAIQGEQPVANAVNEVANGTAAAGRGQGGGRRDPSGSQDSPVDRTSPADSPPRPDRRGTPTRRPTASRGRRGPPGRARTAGPATC